MKSENALSTQLRRGRSKDPGVTTQMLINIPKTVLEAVDGVSKTYHGGNRSHYIRMLIENDLRSKGFQIKD